MANSFTPDEHLRSFAVSVNREIEKYGSADEIKVVERQKAQVEKLVALEAEFRRTLINHHWGPGVYRSFVKFICDERRNILAARPYFRERQNVFAKQISKALKLKADKGLYRFHFNFQFIKFTMNSRKWGNNKSGGKIVKLYNDIVAARTELIEMNIPLVMNRASLFFRRTPPSHLSYMDFIQIGCEALMKGIDKFCLPYSKVFRSVAIGRMVGDFIEQYSETLLHFYPGDKRTLYKANKLVSRYRGGSIDFREIAEDINDTAKKGMSTTPEEIQNLMAAASCVSADQEVEVKDDSKIEPSITKFSAPSDTQPDVRYEEREAYEALDVAFRKLSLFHQKLLRLKGVQF